MTRATVIAAPLVMGAAALLLHCGGGEALLAAGPSAGGAAGAPASGTAGAAAGGAAGAPSSGTAGAPSAAGGPQGGTAGTQAAAGSAGTTTGGASGAPPPTDTTCPTGLPGPALVQLPALGGGSYCMDRTEVTQAQYSVFMDAAAKDPAIAKVPEGVMACPAEARLILRTPGPATGDATVHCSAELFDLEAHPDAPVVCVSHCAARAYCAWAGKELCGAPTGGAAPPGAFADPAQSAWMNACTSGGKIESPADGSTAPDACRAGAGAAERSVEASSGCHSKLPPFDRVLNLGGGVQEWENSCESWGCFARGAFPAIPPAEAATCSFGAVVSGPESAGIGFRCCKPLAGGS